MCRGGFFFCVVFLLNYLFIYCPCLLCHVNSGGESARLHLRHGGRTGQANSGDQGSDRVAHQAS